MWKNNELISTSCAKVCKVNRQNKLLQQDTHIGDCVENLSRSRVTHLTVMTGLNNFHRESQILDSRIISLLQHSILRIGFLFTPTVLHTRVRRGEVRRHFVDSADESRPKQFWVALRSHQPVKRFARFDKQARNESVPMHSECHQSIQQKERSLGNRTQLTPCPRVR